MDHAIFNRPFVHGHELRAGIDAFAHQVCAALSLPKISVEWADGISTAMINRSGDIKVADVRDDARINNATIKRYAGMIVHELLHRKYTDFSARAIPGTENYQYRNRLHNAIEDAWIERLAIKQGLLGNISGLLTALLNGMTQDIEGVDWTDPAQYPFSLAVYAREYCTRVPVPSNLLAVFEQATRRIDAAQSSTDTLAISEWVYQQIKFPPQSEDQPDDKSGDDQSDDESGDDKSGDQSGDQSGNTPSDASESSTGDDQGEGNGVGTPDTNIAPKAGTSKPIREGQESARVEPTAIAESGALSASGSWSQSEIVDPSNHIRRDSARRVSVKAPARLRFEIRRLFDNSATTLFSPNRKSGSVDPRALFKFGTTDRLFAQRRDIDGIDSAVVIVLDLSGSMFSGRIDVAVNTCAAIFDALSSAGVPTALVTFGSEVALQLPFSERQPRAIQTLARVGDAGGTNDYAAIRYAHDLLRNRRESRRVCFVLTDGQGNAAAAAQQIDAGMSAGIRTIGIGILANVSAVYPDSVRVNKLADLDAVSFAQLKKLAA